MLGRIFYRQASPAYTLFKLSKQNFVTSPRNGPIPHFIRLTANKQGICRLYSTIKLEDVTVDFDYVKKATENRNVLIIDVRELEELKEHGKIPNSINIPLGNVTPVLSTMPDNEFNKLYNRPKPTEDTEIIFYCMIGKRSGMAQQNAINLGYKNVKNYLGSYADWANKSQ
ncbi:unnamed protein product [Leptosia nina]|uniref:Rhodanese domain-containing protein n=1 Tax=Leptosia nina TaxID=320188 RepID=A0AAV1J976_9NEOP